MAVIAVNVIAALFVGFILAFSPEVFAQGLNEAVVLNNRAVKLLNAGRYSEAEPLLKQSLAIRERALGPNHPDVATALNNLAELYLEQGRNSDAEPLDKRSLAIREKALGPDHPDVAVSLNSLASLYRAQGRYADAEPLYKRSLAIREKALGPNHPDVGIVMDNLAGLYQDEGHYTDAELMATRALSILAKALGSNSNDFATSLNNLAGIYQAEGRYADAEALYKRSLAISEKVLGPDSPDVATSLNNLAWVLQNEGRDADAEQLLKRALAISEKALGPDHPYVAHSLGNLAFIYQAEGRYADAEALFKRSLAISQKALGPGHPDVARDLNNLAALYLNQGRYVDAEPLYKRSLAIREMAFGPNHSDVGTAINNLAGLYQAQGRYADAEPLYKRALEIAQDAFGSDHPRVASTLNNLVELYQDEGRYVEALPIVQRTISQNQAQRDVVLSVLYGSQSQNLIAPTQALNLSYTVLQQLSSSAAGEAISQLAARFAAGSDELAQLVRKDQDLTAEAERLDKSIIAAVSKPPAARNAAAEEQIRKRIDEIKSERDKLQDVFNQRFPDYIALSKPQPLSVEQTHALLGDDEALIIVDFGKSSYVWVITKGQAEWKQLSISANDIAKEVAILRTGLEADSLIPFDTDLAYQVYQQVLGPIEDVISDKTRLSFVLSGGLTSLPPQVLITSNPEGKTLASVDWLVRKYAITVLPSTASLKSLREEKSTVAAVNPMIGFGDPVFDRTQTAERKKVVALDRSLTSFYRGVTADTKSLADALPALPETADELRAIAKILGARSEDIKLGEAASVTNVKHARLDNYHVVYFATHALVAGEVEKFAKVKAEPALILSIPVKPTEEDDGLLTASEVAMLKLNADFVVLSACNTAAGNEPGAEALSGLARAFFYAGAKSLVVSHWEVDTDSTVELMEGLFDALKANPHLSHAEALRASMLRMIGNSSKPEWNQPRFWAPFVVVGEPRKQ